MKKYFLYQVKKCLLPLAVLTAFAAIVYVLPLVVDDYSLWNSRNGSAYIDLYTGNISAALGIMCAIAPVYMLNYKMKKRSVDMYYSLPLSKTKILAVHFLVGFATVIAAYSAAYWFGFLVVLGKVKGLHYIFYLWLYLASIIPAFIIYTISAFAFTRANTLVDGIIFVIMTHFALFMVMAVAHLALENIKYEYSYYLNPGAFMASGPLIRVADVLGERIHYSGDTGYNGWSIFQYWGTFPTRTYNIVHDVIAFGIITLAAAGATAAIFLTESEVKAENCEHVSESIFGYRSMIPLYTAAFTISLTEAFTDAGTENNIIAWCVITFCAYIANVVWRRSLKIGKKQAILLAVYIFASAVAGLIINSI